MHQSGERLLCQGVTPVPCLGCRQKRLQSGGRPRLFAPRRPRRNPPGQGSGGSWAHLNQTSPNGGGRGEWGGGGVEGFPQFPKPSKCHHCKDLRVDWPKKSLQARVTSWNSSRSNPASRLNASIFREPHRKHALRSRKHYAHNCPLFFLPLIFSCPMY